MIGYSSHTVIEPIVFEAKVQKWLELYFVWRPRLVAV